MSTAPLRYLHLSLLMLCCCALRAQPKIPFGGEYKFGGALTCSYSGESHYRNNSGTAILISNESYFQHTNWKNENGHDFRFRSMLSFLREGDSTWIKSADRFTLDWSQKHAIASWRTLYTFQLASQWLSDYSRAYTGDTPSLVWSGGFMNPCSLLVTAGISRELFRNSRLEIGLAAMRLSVLPRSPFTNEEVRANSMVLPHSYLTGEYGGSIHFIVNEKLAETVALEQNSRLFFNRFADDGVHAAFQNSLKIQLLKWVLLKIDTSILYEPEINRHIQYRQEVMLGLFFEKESPRDHPTSGF